MRPLHHCAAAVALVAGVTLSACGVSSPAAGAAATTAPTSVPAQASPTSAKGQEPPTTKAPIPPGTYRVRITAQELVDAGAFDGQSAGTWTLTLGQGRYQLHCARVEKESEQCGNSADLGADRGMVVEVGTTAGDASTLWLVYDQASTLAVNHCDRCNPTNRQLAPYRLDWSLEGNDLVLKNVWSASGYNKDLPELNNYSLKPWKKIG